MIYVFDLDGTLINSMDRHSLLMRQILKEKGIHVPMSFEKDFISFKADGNLGIKYLIEILDLNLQIAREIFSDWIEHIEDENWLKYDKLYYDSIKTCEKCVSNNKKIFFLTSRKNRQGLYVELERLRLSQYPTKVIIADPVNAKDDKSVALRKIVIEHEQCIMVGDSEVDFHAACEANCQYYLLNRGFRSERFWKRQGINSFPSLEYLYI